MEDGFEEALDVAGGNDGDTGRPCDGLHQVIEDFGANFVEHLRHEVWIGLIAAAQKRHSRKLLRDFIVNDESAGSGEGPQNEEWVMGEAGQHIARDDEGGVVRPDLLSVEEFGFTPKPNP